MAQNTNDAKGSIEAERCWCNDPLWEIFFLSACFQRQLLPLTVWEGRWNTISCYECTVGIPPPNIYTSSCPCSASGRWGGTGIAKAWAVQNLTETSNSLEELRVRGKISHPLLPSGTLSFDQSFADADSPNPNLRCQTHPFGFRDIPV